MDTPRLIPGTDPTFAGSRRHPAVAAGGRRVVDQLPDEFDLGRSESEWLLTLLGAEDLRYIFEGSVKGQSMD